MTFKYIVDFKQGTDTGESTDSAAIAPINPGEAVRATNINRPTDNLRKRTESLKDYIESGLSRDDSNMRYIISSIDGAANAPQIASWTPTTGIVRLASATNELVIQPLNSNDINFSETAVYDFGVDPDDAALKFNTTRKSYASPSANETIIRWAKSTSQVPACVVVSSGSPKHILTITLRDGGDAVTYTDVRSALVAVAGTELAYVGLGLSAPYSTDPAIDLTAFPTEYAFSTTYEREKHTLAKTELHSFNDLNPLMADGDSILIRFDDFADRRAGGTVTSGQLFLSSEHPELIPMAIPLVKRIGNLLYWLDGTISVGPTTVAHYFGECQNTVTRIDNYAATYVLPAYAPTGPFATTSPLNPLAANPLQTQLQTIINKLNTKASLDALETAQQHWAFNQYLTIYCNNLAANVDGTKSAAVYVREENGEFTGIPGKYSSFHTLIKPHVVDSSSVITAFSALLDCQYAKVGITPTGASALGMDLTAWSRGLDNFWTCVVAGTGVDTPAGAGTYPSYNRLVMRRGRPTGSNYSVVAATQDEDDIAQFLFQGVNHGLAYDTIAYMSVKQSGPANSGSNLYGYVTLVAAKPGGDVTQLTLDAYAYSALLAADSNIKLSMSQTDGVDLALSTATFLQLKPDTLKLQLDADTFISLGANAASIAAGTGASFITMGPTSASMTCPGTAASSKVEVEDDRVLLRRSFDNSVRLYSSATECHARTRVIAASTDVDNGVGIYFKYIDGVGDPQEIAFWVDRNGLKTNTTLQQNVSTASIPNWLSVY